MLANIKMRLLAAVRWVKAFWLITPPQVVESPEAQPEQKPKRVRVVDPSAKELREFKKDVLGSLSDYFVHIERLKSTDRDAYDLMSRLGGKLLESSPLNKGGSLFSIQSLEPIWQTSRPAFLFAFFLPPDRVESKVFVKFAYMKKVSGFELIQPVTGADSYIVSLVYDDKQDTKVPHPFIVEFAVAVNADSLEFRVLKTLEAETVPLRRGKFIRQVWRLPASLSLMASELKENPDSLARKIFCLIANASSASAHDMICITAEKGKTRAKFSVEPEEAKSFFRDREPVLDQNGRNIRIFHSVRPHSRMNGAAVRFHFRGLRNFIWHGYRIKIDIPGRGIGRLFDFSGSTREVDVLANDCVGAKTAAKMLAKVAA